MKLDATMIIPGLFQGGKPPEGPHVRMAGFEVLVLCAREYQPTQFPGVQVIHAPNDDNGEPATREDTQVALQAARQVAAALARRKKVLVTCWMGWNRSGLVSALSLYFYLGVSGFQAARMVKAKRAKALGNQHFFEMLSNLKARPASG